MVIKAFVFPLHLLRVADFVNMSRLTAFEDVRDRRGHLVIDLVSEAHEMLKPASSSKELLFLSHQVWPCGALTTSPRNQLRSAPLRSVQHLRVLTL